MRVLYVSKALVVAAYRDKIHEMARAGLDVTAVIPHEWGGEPAEPTPPGRPDPRRAKIVLSGHNHLHLYRNPSRWLDGVQPDLVHIDEEPYSLVTLQLAWHCRRRGIPCVFFAWQNVIRRLPPPFGRVRSTVFDWVSGGIGGTPRAGEVLRHWGFAGPLAVIPQFGVDPARFAPDPAARSELRCRMGIPRDAFLVGYAGWLRPDKGVGLLVDALARLAGCRDGHPPAEHLIYIGKGEERDALAAQARRAGVGDRVHFTGHLPSLEMPSALAALDVLVLPSVGTPTLQEQFGRVLVEAMACEVAVVGSDTGEIPHVMGPVGEVVPAGEVEPLVDALVRFRDDPERRRRCGLDGRARVLERFSQEVVARRTADFYREVA